MNKHPKYIERTAHGHTITRIGLPEGEKLLRCTCGWSNFVFVLQDKAIDLMNAHLRSHATQKEQQRTDQPVSATFYFPQDMMDEALAHIETLKEEQ